MLERIIIILADNDDDKERSSLCLCGEIQVKVIMRPPKYLPHRNPISYFGITIIIIIVRILDSNDNDDDDDNDDGKDEK